MYIFTCPKIHYTYVIYIYMSFSIVFNQCLTIASEGDKESNLYKLHTTLLISVNFIKLYQEHISYS